MECHWFCHRRHLPLLRPNFPGRCSPYMANAAREISSSQQPLDLAILRPERESGALLDRSRNFRRHLCSSIPIPLATEPLQDLTRRRSDRRSFRHERRTIAARRTTSRKNSPVPLLRRPQHTPSARSPSRTRSATAKCFAGDARAIEIPGGAGRRDRNLSRERWRNADRRGRADQLRAVWFHVPAGEILHERKANAPLAPPAPRFSTSSECSSRTGHRSSVRAKASSNNFCDDSD